MAAVWLWALLSSGALLSTAGALQFEHFPLTSGKVTTFSHKYIFLLRQSSSSCAAVPFHSEKGILDGSPMLIIPEIYPTHLHVSSFFPSL
jgi:hypothetical protein